MNRPALVVAGVHSGCGKTTLTLGIMAALVRRGLAVQPFKCGPDFIDPSLHQMVTGRVSRNLDVRMCGADFVRRSFARHSLAGDCSVIEGVMGLFDGGDGSAATLAKTLDLPVVLVLDVRSMAESAAAVVHGFATLDPDLRVAGIICNRCGSDKHRAMIETAVNATCSVPVLGCLPRDEAIAIPSRHLGLHMGGEAPLGAAELDRLADLIETHLDMELLLRIAATAAPRPEEPETPVPPPVVRLGVARDAAFCFYYQDNLDLLRQAGAELVMFSPLHDDVLPPDLDGLYLGGGYPELHARGLSANHSMRARIAALAAQGLPIYAECGGFMYLCASLTDQEGTVHPMVGVYPFRAAMQPRLRSLGYRQVRVDADCLLAPSGATLYGHEFHYSAIDSHPEVATVFHLDNERDEGYHIHQTLAGYLHLHWGRTPEVATRLVHACRTRTRSFHG
ncbi:MAG: cobyrinate a,c-diamide synthase [Desulfobulbus sp.]|jgi:cobyrinic acid a,c-diamide synthase